jgi:hypothetical protein
MRPNSRFCPYIYLMKLRKTTKHVRIAEAPAKIENEPLPNTCLERYR